LPDLADHCHIILEDNIYRFLPFVDELSRAIESILLPGASDLVAAGIGHHALSMSDVVVKVAIEDGALSALEDALAMSDSIRPLAIIGGAIDPGTLSGPVSLAMPVKLARVLSWVQPCDGMRGDALLPGGLHHLIALHWDILAVVSHVRVHYHLHRGAYRYNILSHRIRHSLISVGLNYWSLPNTCHGTTDLQLFIISHSLCWAFASYQWLLS
jgi:hypothetical protein